ncbi:MAG: XRE family transcriptional regulator [Armatimonadota bacterium]|nr:XRE family transcriptional regulator [Armatimonadota bacterium]
MKSFGERLKQARAAAGLSQRDLAEAAGPLSANAISKYERDLMEPGSDVLRRLAAALRVKTGYFYRPVQVSVKCPAYRKHSRLGKRQQHSVEARIVEFLERYIEVEEMFEPGQVPTFELPDACGMDISEVADVEEFADRLRDQWELGADPIANLCETLEDQGVKVILLDDVDDQFDGYSCWANEQIPVVASRGDAALPGDRQRFTLAHELAHLLLERTKMEGVDVERACHRFAAAFLVPRSAVFPEVGQRRDGLSYVELLSLKQKWGLSMSAWVRRMADLGIISQGQYRSAMKQFRSKGWHNREPGEQVEPERTLRFERLVQRAVAEDLISVARAADFLGKPLIEVRKEMGWPTAEVAEA